MKLVIENGKNISLTESLSIAYEFIGNFGLLEIVRECESDKHGMSKMCIKESPTNYVIYFAKLTEKALTIIVNREYIDEEDEI